MKILLKKFFNLNKTKSHKDAEFEKILNRVGINKIFNAFSKYSNNSEIRFVGGCVRKILNYEEIDDIDFATNVKPDITQLILDKNNINYFKTGLKHGTITAVINKQHFEITSLREDITTDGRHADVKFTKDWFIDASRRDFTINSIYADKEGNLFDPFGGKKDLKNGIIKFIGDPDKRIKEDYLRILRYIRFFNNYSEVTHKKKIKKIIRKNISGINIISKDRLISELKKIFLSKKFVNISQDTFSIEILNLIFPEIKNINLFNKLNDDAIELLSTKDFIFLLSLSIIDGTDNTDYFLYKYNLSNEDKKRIKFLSKNYKNLNEKNFFNEKNLSKLHYNYPELILDLIDFKIFSSKKASKNLLDLKKIFLIKSKPLFPIKAQFLIEQYNLAEGKELGIKIRELERLWIKNCFKISNKEIENVVKN